MEVTMIPFHFLIFFYVAGDHVPSLLFPLVPIHPGVIQILVRRHTKGATLAQFFGQGDDVKVKESNLTHIPAFGGIAFGAALHVSLVHLGVEALVPLDVDVPVLHGVGNV